MPPAVSKTYPILCGPTLGARGFLAWFLVDTTARKPLAPRVLRLFLVTLFSLFVLDCLLNAVRFSFVSLSFLYRNNTLLDMKFSFHLTATFCEHATRDLKLLDWPQEKRVTASSLHSLCLCSLREHPVFEVLVSSKKSRKTRTLSQVT